MVIEKQTEALLSILLADRLLCQFEGDVIESISFDKDFYRRETKSC